MKIVRIAVSLIIITFIVMIHEVGHWVEMNRHGVEVEEVAAGMSFGLPRYTFTLSSFPGTTFAVNPLPLGAYVKTSKKGGEVWRTLPYKHKAVIDGAGIWANILTGILFGICHVQLKKRISREKKLVATLIGVGAFIALYFLKNIFCWSIPLIWFIGAALLAVVLIRRRKNRKVGRNKGGKVTGSSIIGIVNDSHPIVFSRKIFGFCESLCFGLAAINLLPIGALDGGHIAETVLGMFLPEKAITVFSIMTMTLLVFLALKMMSEDTLRLFGKKLQTH